MTATPNFGLTLPTVGGDSDAWGGELNAGLTTIDAVLCRGQNLVINGDLRINQRAYISAATLAVGSYGHDRWKGGASGGNYSFTQLASPTAVTIAANKSIIQVIEDKNVVGGSYILSWTGTATGRLTINNVTPSGNFAVSPITVTGQTAGTVMSLELTGANAAGGSSVATNTGTAGQIKLELGAVASPFVPDDYSVSLERCRRYCRAYAGKQATDIIGSCGQALSSTVAIYRWTLEISMRTAPTVVAVSTTGNYDGGALVGTSLVAAVNMQQDCLAFNLTSGGGGLTAGHAVNLYLDSGSMLVFDAEL